MTLPADDKPESKEDFQPMQPHKWTPGGMERGAGVFDVAWVREGDARDAIKDALTASRSATAPTEADLAYNDAELGRLRFFRRNIEEAEARCCPEDVGFEEWIGILTKRLDAALSHVALTPLSAENKASRMPLPPEVLAVFSAAHASELDVVEAQGERILTLQRELAEATASLDRCDDARIKAEDILRKLVEAASADKLEDFSRTSKVADMAADFMQEPGADLTRAAHEAARREGTPVSSSGAISKDGLLVSEERVCSILAERFKPESEEFRKARKAALVILHEARHGLARSATLGTTQHRYAAPFNMMGPKEEWVQIRFVPREHIHDKPTEANPSPIRVIVMHELEAAQPQAMAFNRRPDGSAAPTFVGVDHGKPGGDFTGYACSCGQVRVGTDGPCEQKYCPIPATLGGRKV